ncbi:MAG: hypothetical protein IJ693_00690 [Bacteroidaceae bacterium]|nr:hypothetical protein [Bacteroidaceae bacterium]
MKEDKIDTFRQKDVNLREAIRMEEMERPQMPSDLNARLMQRVANEAGKEKPHRGIVWPWIAAACVAGVIAIYLTPPKTKEHHPIAYHHRQMPQNLTVRNMDEPYQEESFECVEKVMRGRRNQLLYELKMNENH